MADDDVRHGEEPADRVAYEPAPLGCLGAVLVLGGWALVWLLVQAVRWVRELVGW